MRHTTNASHAAMQSCCLTCRCWHGRWPPSHWSSEGHRRSGGWQWCAFSCEFPTANKSHRRVRRAELEEASPRVTFKTKEAWNMAEADTEARQRRAKVWERLTAKKTHKAFAAHFCKGMSLENEYTNAMIKHLRCWREAQQQGSLHKLDFGWFFE